MILVLRGQISNLSPVMKKKGSVPLLQKGCDKMQTKKISISYNDYLRGINFLNIDEQLTLLEIISARLKKSIGQKKKSSIMQLEGLGANLWKGIDAHDYVQKERESWS